MTKTKPPKKPKPSKPEKPPKKPGRKAPVKMVTQGIR